jgi:hypothetical protein
MSEGDGIIDSEVAAMLLGISKNNLRQLVYRKGLVPVGRHKRRSRFLLVDVLALQTRRGASSTTGNTSAP